MGVLLPLDGAGERGRPWRVAGAMGSVRWAFPCAAWRPCREEWLLAARLVQPEEKDRIGQFVFARDAKAALVHAGGGWGTAGGSFPSLRAGGVSPWAGLKGRVARSPPSRPSPLLRRVRVSPAGPCPSAGPWWRLPRAPQGAGGGRSAEEPPLAPRVAPGPALSRGDAIVSLQI